MSGELVVPSRPDDLDELRQRMQRARWRLRSAAQGGPEWDAASALVEEVEGTLQAAVLARASKRARRGAVAG